MAHPIITLGSKGCCTLDADGKMENVPAVKASAVDTTGAGDAFWGGFLSCVLNHGVSSVNQLNAELLQEAVRYGNVSGSLSVQQKGAISSLPTREQVEQFLAEHKN